MGARHKYRAVSQEFYILSFQARLFVYTNENSGSDLQACRVWKCVRERRVHLFHSRDPICLATMAPDIAKQGFTCETFTIHIYDRQDALGVQD